MLTAGEQLPGALDGIKVLDLSHYLAGPYCTMILADLGAEIIKIEEPGKGDGSRQWGPPFIDSESSYYLSVNRNKKSISLNLKAPRGVEIFNKMASSADVVLESYRPGVAERLGIGYTSLSAVNPRLIYCSISGFGQNGPYREKPAYDIIAQAMGGLMNLTGEKNGAPVKIGVAIADICAGMFAAIGILAAITARERTSRGQMVDISLLDGQVSWLSHQAGYFLTTGKNPERLGSAHPSIAPYQAFRAKDSYFVIAVGNDSLWAQFCKALGLNRLMDDNRFATNPQRVRNREELVKLLEAFFASKSSKEWLEIISAAGVPCGPIYGLSEVFTDPQVLHRQMLEEVEHPKLGRTRVVGVPIKLSLTPASVRTHPPMLGEHTEEVLLGLGLSSGDISELKKGSII
jgi:formyl-CoA transferase/CoA:oxalate CoA-transferase